MIAKNPPVRSKEWLKAVHEIEICVLCGSYGVQVAHRNEGKGMGMKSSDCNTAAICPSCHSAIDQGGEMTRDERRAMLDKAIVLTHEQLIKAGRLVLR